jgi:hypothetical protein
MQPTETVEPPTGDLVPDTRVIREFGISSMTLHRWTHDPKLGFPPAIKIRNRNFRSRKQLEAFKQRMLRQSIAARGEAA